MGDHFDESDHDLGQEEPMLPDSSGQRYQHKRDAMKILEANHFVCIEKLGSGAFGDVYKMMDFSGQEVAVKVVSLEVTKKSEIEIWPKMRHPNIIPLLRYISFSNPDVGVFVMPVHRGTLKDAVQNEHFLSQSSALDCLKSWLYDTLCGLAYLHSNEACHLDLKSDNILISQDYRAVICDFSCLASATKAIPRPPEACLSLGGVTEVDGKAFDMWAYGVMVLELFTSKALSNAITCAGNWNRDIYPAMFHILQGDVFKCSMSGAFSATGIADGQVRLALNFIHTFLMPDRRKRWSAGKAIDHCFFKSGGQIGTGPDAKWLHFCGEESQEISMPRNQSVKRVADVSVKPLNAKKPNTEANT
ncbi:probable serine/threonine-protein kinase DDB_G0284251 [Parasteatoda tepidariorum]|uniref:probable serine/threonine-protein kinase DDB_G0284251 n=1 Tax=Parasteatoda tepidariorum TaxID=114398 RepID=UPI00077FB95A|nr:probable serine/threonine-protein kinase DDB_G0284251 [Parasteatoda tepidariorum]